MGGPRKPQGEPTSISRYLTRGQNKQQKSRSGIPRQDIAKEVDEEILLEQKHTIKELQETVGIMELKISKLEQLVRVKDSKINKLQEELMKANS